MHVSQFTHNFPKFVKPEKDMNNKDKQKRTFRKSTFTDPTFENVFYARTVSPICPSHSKTRNGIAQSAHKKFSYFTQRSFAYACRRELLVLLAIIYLCVPAQVGHRKVKRECIEYGKMRTIGRNEMKDRVTGRG